MKKSITKTSTTNLSKQLIVCKYKESTSWLSEFYPIPCIIYNKSDPQSTHHLPNIPRFPIHQFEGVRHHKTPTGRESLAYLYHIIKHYDNLADITIFLQGNPIQENSDVRDALRIHVFQDFEGIDFIPLNFPLVLCDPRGAPLHQGLPIERIFKRLFQGECPSILAYSWGAMFCVSRHNILKRPLSFYEEMMQIIFDEPLSGYAYERLWSIILSSFDFLPHATYTKRDRSLWQLPGLT